MIYSLKNIEEIITNLINELHLVFLNDSIEDIEDSVMDAIMEYIEHRPDCQSEQLFLSWLYIAARNNLIDKQRKNIKFKNLNILHLEGKDFASFIKSILFLHGLATEHNMDLLRATDKLSKKELEVIENHYIQGYTFAEMSKFLQCTEATLRQRHKRALEKLRKSMGVPPPPQKECQKKIK